MNIYLHILMIHYITDLVFPPWSTRNFSWCGIMIGSQQTGRESFKNAFSSNLGTVNLTIFPNHGGIYFGRQSLQHSIELWKDLSLRLVVKRCQKSCHVQFPLFWAWPGVLIYDLKSSLHIMPTLLGILCKACLIF